MNKDEKINYFIETFKTDFRTRLMPTNEIRDEHEIDIIKRMKSILNKIIK